ncbi:MAG TPA: cytochrome c biogenesis protein CcdA [Candidatus Eisenbacteria bacterium]|nr:cytochrome c biogenesis protein CcdA [Candidatus Eisenbacteria bacterium]
MKFVPALALTLLAAVFTDARAQLGTNVPEAAELVQITTVEAKITAGGSVRARIELAIAEGWHVNANPPALDYLIPTEVEVSASSGIVAGSPIYPAPKKAKLAFDDNELLVYDGAAVIEVPLTAAASSPGGRRTLSGTLRFQACNDQICLAPATVAFKIPVDVEAGASSGTAPMPQGAGAPADSAPGTGTAPSSSFQIAPPAQGSQSAAIGKSLEAALASGGLVWFLALFVGGLFLNLTPCVFPMLGVTVSIFGARRQEPLPTVISAASLYVLGIVVMYSTLGVVAALTGGLFGAALQSVWVGIALGALLIGLSLSMFGLYEMQPPAWLLQRVGGANTTSAMGLFVSGLMVGIIAAPCVGPFVVAVLAMIAQRGDAMFGFRTMFALALGLGFPYLFLASFSNLLQRLPRSGDWMVWVKKVFGVILLGVGLFYLLLAIAPDWAPWVLPAALVLGGIYLGFIDRSATARPRFRLFRYGVGALAALAGVMVVATTPRQSVAFEPFAAEVLAADLGRGHSVMIDFSADWCAPCHELDRFTFTDSRVRALARSFRAYRVDLTRYDSPESKALKQRYGISGVPTVVFIGPDGQEVMEARVEGFLPPEHFLERMKYAGRRTGAMATNQ